MIGGKCALFPSKHDGEVKSKSGGQTGPRYFAGGFSFFWAALERQRSFDPIHDPFCLLLCPLWIDRKKKTKNQKQKCCGFPFIFSLSVTGWTRGKTQQTTNNQNTLLGIYCCCCWRMKNPGRWSSFLWLTLRRLCVCAL